MTEKEITKWFLNKFNSCYCVSNKKYKCRFLMIYNKNIVRQKKLSRILDKDIFFEKNVNDVCLFEFENNILWCDDDEIWEFLMKNYTTAYNEIAQLIQKIIYEKFKINIKVNFVNLKSELSLYDMNQWETTIKDIINIYKI